MFWKIDSYYKDYMKDVTFIQFLPSPHAENSVPTPSFPYTL